jgi:adenylate cyclase
MLEVEEGVGLQWLFRLRGSLTAPDKVVVVAIAGASADVYGLSTDLDEWPRNLHAELIERLVDADVAGIVMDIMTSAPASRPSTCRA